MCLDRSLITFSGERRVQLNFGKKILFILDLVNTRIFFLKQKKSVFCTQILNHKFALSLEPQFGERKNSSSFSRKKKVETSERTSPRMDRHVIDVKCTEFLFVKKKVKMSSKVQIYMIHVLVFSGAFNSMSQASSADGVFSVVMEMAQLPYTLFC